jgi:hypothetical protein
LVTPAHADTGKSVMNSAALLRVSPAKPRVDGRASHARLSLALPRAALAAWRSWPCLAPTRQAAPGQFGRALVSHA